jgi:hypothetical protein
MRNRFYKALQEQKLSPDWPLFLIYADWEAEYGDPKLAKIWRFFGTTRIRPDYHMSYHMSDMYMWYIISEPHLRRFYSEIPRFLGDLLCGKRHLTDMLEYGGAAEAYEDLIQAFLKVDDYLAPNWFVF